MISFRSNVSVSVSVDATDDGSLHRPSNCSPFCPKTHNVFPTLTPPMTSTSSILASINATMTPIIINGIYATNSTSSSMLKLTKISIPALGYFSRQRTHFKTDTRKLLSSFMFEVENLSLSMTTLTVAFGSNEFDLVERGP